MGYFLILTLFLPYVACRVYLTMGGILHALFSCPDVQLGIWWLVCTYCMLMAWILFRWLGYLLSTWLTPWRYLALDSLLSSPLFFSLACEIPRYSPIHPFSSDYLACPFHHLPALILTKWHPSDFTADPSRLDQWVSVLFTPSAQLDVVLL